MEYEPTPEQLKGYTLKDSGKPHRRTPTCTDYVDVHDKVWNREAREKWKQQSAESMQHIQAKYSPVPAPNAPQATIGTKWDKIPSRQK